jgi:CBS domain-containing protein
MPKGAKMSVLVKLAHKPIVSIGPGARVIDAINLMLERRVGAALVLDGTKPVGIFTERDVMAKVVAKRTDPETTPITALMTAPVELISSRATPTEALRIMVERHFRHLPVVDEAGHLVGMLSMRHLMRDQIRRLEDQVGALENYIGTEGISGG